MKNLDLKTLPATLLPLLNKVKRYVVIIFIGVVVLVYGFLVLRINTFAQTEPTDEAVTERLKAVQRPKIDADALEKIQQLEDQNVEVQTLFKQARDNPFSE
ncbi:MAG: hypothetical protein JWL85_472 [Candidatus Saccharibacteria bacterium]|nr:hypothetical protein [Candidatus Saccharibacteria bacterium]